MSRDLIDRFEMVARAKLAATIDVYRRLETEPQADGDKALNLRHATAKVLLGHIALLRKMLGADMKPGASGRAYYDQAELDAMLAEVREGRDD